MSLSDWLPKHATKWGLISVVFMAATLATAQTPALQQTEMENNQPANGLSLREQERPPPAGENLQASYSTDQERATPKLYKSTCGDTESHPEADLCEQKKMAISARETVVYAQWQLIISVIGLVAVGFSLLFTGWATIAASRAANAATEAVGTERAWISLHRPETGTGTNVNINGVQHEQAFVISLSLLNSGRSPALNATLYISNKITKSDKGVPIFEKT